jgi:hypothetical protein
MANHPRNPGYIPGDHWVECEVCGLEYRQSKMHQRWDGFIVCPKDFEFRNPQDFVRARKEDISARGLVNAPAEDSFVAPACATRSAVAGVAIAGCAIAGYSAATVPSSTF